VSAALGSGPVNPPVDIARTHLAEASRLFHPLLFFVLRAFRSNTFSLLIPFISFSLLTTAALTLFFLLNTNDQTQRFSIKTPDGIFERERLFHLFFLRYWMDSIMRWIEWRRLNSFYISGGVLP
jgi:hypothetical protein